MTLDCRLCPQALAMLGPLSDSTVTMCLLDRLLDLSPSGAAQTDAQSQLPLHVALKHRECHCALARTIPESATPP